MTDSAELPYCLPPHPNPSKPSYKPPEGAVDAHFHIFGPPEFFPWAPPEQRVYTPPAAPLAHYRQVAAHLGFERGVVVQPMAHGFDNAATLDAIARSDGRLFGVARVASSFPDSALEALHEGGIRGVRFTLDTGGPADRTGIRTVVDRIRPFGWSATFHARPRHLIEDAEWFSALPVPVVIDHFGRVDFSEGPDQPAFRSLVELLRNTDHVHVKISCIERCSANCPPWMDSVPFAHALLDAAPERLLWGTDWPHSQRYALGEQCDTGALVDMIPVLVPDESLRRQILVENPARLFHA